MFAHYPAHEVLVPLRSLPPSVSLGLGVHLGHRPPLASLWCSSVHPHVDSRLFPGGCSIRSGSFLPSVSRRSPYSDTTTHGRPIRLPLGCFVLLTPCPHPPRLIDLSCESPSVQSTPIRGKGCELFNLSKSGQPIRAVALRPMTIVILHPTFRSERLGHLAQPLWGSTDRWRVAWFLFPVGNLDGCKRGGRHRYGCR